MEPKWNVKCMLLSFSRSYPSINGTKVECKDRKEHEDNAEATVLMEPKWNVKVIRFVDYYVSRLVLMEPKWNVKIIEKKVSDIDARGIN